MIDSTPLSTSSADDPSQIADPRAAMPSDGDRDPDQQLGLHHVR